jgi:hypothetical protein
VGFVKIDAVKAILIHSFYSLSYDKCVTSSKAISPLAGVNKFSVLTFPYSLSDLGAIRYKIPTRNPVKPL